MKRIHPLFLLLITVFFFNGCGSKKENVTKDLSKYADYIDYYTEGVISRKDPITLRFKDDILLGKEELSKLLTIKPAIKGEVVKLNERTISYQSINWMPSGTEYEVKCKLDLLYPSIAQEDKTLTFTVQSKTQDFEVRSNNLEPYDESDWTLQQYTGSITTADVVENKLVEGMITFQYPYEGITMNWNHESNTSHNFTISGIKRLKEEKLLQLTFNGKTIDVDRVESKKVNVPSIGSFELISAEVINDGTPYISVIFSDPIKENQDIKGFITVDGRDNLRFEIDQNEIKGYFKSKPSGSKTLSVAPGIKSKFNTSFKSEFSKQLAFEILKPEVQFVSEGSYIPANETTKLTFRAVNLKAVDVDIIKISADNVPQFFQVNTISGSNQMRRVAKPLLRRKITLGNNNDELSTWKTYDLDLGKIIAQDQGAIYQVNMSFRQSYAVLPCVNASETEEIQENELSEWESDSEAFDSYGSYGGRGYYYPEGYEWRERQNPCHVSYYTNERRIVKNVLATDIGLIAKAGLDQSVKVFTTSLISAEPKSGVQVSILNYQMEELASQQTDREGVAYFSPDERPFLVVARDGSQFSYLKLNEGSSLSLSNFDVSGAKVKHGLKGFIYGERGVWRPGDDIHLNFILEDNSDRIPADFPVNFKLKDPSGNVKDKESIRASRLGLYGFSTKTSAEDPTGNWSAEVSIGNTVFSKVIKVETVKPNRLKINLDFGTEKFTASNNSVTADLSVKWLTGLNAKNLEANFDMELSSMPVKFKGYNNYSFIDNSKEFYTTQDRIFSGQLDEKGHASVPVKLKVDKNVPGALRATFKGKVFEAGGDFSIDQFSIPYYPYSQYVGVRINDLDKRGRLEANDNYTINIASLDANGKPLSVDDLKVEVRKVNWRWWWDEYEGRSNYINNRNGSLVFSGKVNTSSGKGTASFSTKERWGRYHVKVTNPISGHSAGRTFYIYSRSWWDSGQEGLGASYLAFNADKDEYEVGEKVKLTIPGSKKGKALVSIENGKRVVKTYWVDTQAELTNFEFDVTAEMSPNVYISLALMQPYAQTSNDLPIRLYGIAPIEVVNKDTELHPVIDLPKKVGPQEKFTVEISENSNREMAYTIAIVDEGLLDITKFKTPAPKDYFYAKEALGVRTWDLYDDIVGRYTGKIDKMLSIGGDGVAKEDKANKANRFKPVVLYAGPFYLGKGESRKHEFTMPQYIGSVRAMVVAANDQNKSYGSAETTMPVTMPLMVQGTMPRVVGPGESVKLPVNIFALEDNIGKVIVTVKTEGVLMLQGNAKQELVIEKKGDVMGYFDLKVKAEEGIGKVMITATGKGKVATAEIEIDSRIPNSGLSKLHSFVIEEASSKDISIPLVGATGTNEVNIEVSSIPPLNIEKRLDYLIRYPHGCLEQTVSSVFPQLYLGDLVALDVGQRARVEDNIKKAIRKLSRFQTSSGGFSLWQGMSNVHFWANNYAGHFLIEAKSKGYDIPVALYNKWKKYQTSRARNWRSGKRDDGDFIQAYRLYTLALANIPQRGAMNRLSENKELNQMSYWMLAGSYAEIGRKDLAKKLIETMPLKGVSKYHYYYSYGSVERDQAIMLEVLKAIGENAKALQVVKDLSKALSSNQWMSTQTTAFSLMAVSKFIGAGEHELNVKLDFSNGEQKQLQSAHAVASVKYPLKGKKSADFKVSNVGKGKLFVTVLSTGKPIEGQEKAAANGIAFKVSYLDRNGNNILPEDLAQGTDFKVRVTVRNEGYHGTYRDLALTQVFPSGWEINNDRLNDLNTNQEKRYTYQDIRDDRVYTYFDLSGNNSVSFETKMTATYEGRFYLPAFKVEAMYDNEIFANNEGKWVKVVKQ